MLLAAHFERAVQGVRRAGQCPGHITAAHAHWRQHKTLRYQGRAHVQDGGQGFNVRHHQPGCTACQHHAVGHHQANDLTHVLHRVLCQYGFIAGKGGQHFAAWHVCGQHHGVHTGQGQRGLSVDTQQLAVGHSGQDGCRIQRAAQFRDVVDVSGGTGNLGCRTFVWVRLAAGHAGICAIGQIGSHGCSPSRHKLARLVLGTP